MNRIAAQLALSEPAHRSAAMDADTLEAIRHSLSSVPPEFWSVVGHTELDMYIAISTGALAERVDQLVEDFRKHHERVASRWMWGSVLDTATFVLSRYHRVASREEQRAATRLLGALEVFAGWSAPAEPPTATPAPGVHPAPAKASPKPAKRKKSAKQKSRPRVRRLPKRRSGRP